MISKGFHGPSHRKDTHPETLIINFVCLEMATFYSFGAASVVIPPKCPYLFAFMGRAMEVDNLMKLLSLNNTQSLPVFLTMQWAPPSPLTPVQHTTSNWKFALYDSRFKFITLPFLLSKFWQLSLANILAYPLP